MALKENEKYLLEAVKNALDAKALGLLSGKDKHKETSHFQQFKFEDIQNMMFLKVNESPYAQAITAAFYKNHSYKYIDDPSFQEGFVKDMKAMGVPATEQQKAVNALNNIIQELTKDGFVAEKDYGWNPNMDKLQDLTSNADNRKPTREAPFNSDKIVLRPTEINAEYKQMTDGGNKA